MKQREIYILLISSFVLVLFWIAFSIYHNSVTSTIPQTLNVQIIPINPTFDTKTVSDIKTRPEIEPIYEIDEQATPSASPTPSIDASPEGTMGGTIRL